MTEGMERTSFEEEGQEDGKRLRIELLPNRVATYSTGSTSESICLRLDPRKQELLRRSMYDLAVLPSSVLDSIRCLKDQASPDLQTRSPPTSSAQLMSQFAHFIQEQPG